MTNVEQSDLVSAIEQTADGIVITDIEGIIRYVNPAFTTITGYTSEDVLGQSTRILKSGRQPAGFYAELWNTIRSGQVWHGDMINRRKDGSLYEEEMRITPVKDSLGEIVSYVGIKHDVSMRRLAEERKREGELCFRRAFEFAPFGMFMSGPHEQFTQVNAAFCKMLGYSEQELLGTAWTRLIHHDDVEFVLRKSTQLSKEQNRNVDIETRYIHQGGSVVWGRVRVVQARDFHGHPQFLVFYVEDITESFGSREKLPTSARQK